MDCRSCFWQRDVESGTVIDRRFRPYPAAMPMHDSLDRGEPDTGAFEGFLRMKALENTK